MRKFRDNKSFGFMGLEYDREKNCPDYMETAEKYRDFLDNKELHYSHKLRRWVLDEEYEANGGSVYPSDFPCRSVKAAVRHIRNHDEIPRGTVFRLVNWYIGAKDIYLVKH